MTLSDSLINFRGAEMGLGQSLGRLVRCPVNQVLGGCIVFLAGLLALVASPSLCVAAHGSLLFKLSAPSAQQGGLFGDAVAAVGGDVLVGETSRLGVEGIVGQAYLFDGRTGELKLQIYNPKPSNKSAFGSTLDGGDGLLFLGVQELQSEVYVFDQETGALLRGIADPDGESGFGAGVAYGEGGLLVATPSHNLSPSLPAVGRVQVFNPASGELQRVISNPEPNSYDGFGNPGALAMFGDRLAVGSIADNAFDGRVWIFDRTTGNPLFALENPRPDTPPPLNLSDWFGWSVAGNSRIIVAGAREDDSSGVEGSGTVYVFDSGTGNLLHTLYSPQPESNGEFGRSVRLTPQGDVLVGAWGTTVDGVEAAGHVYLFDGDTGNLLLDIPNPEPSEFAQFGWSLDASGSQLVVSARGAYVDGVPSAGAVYVYSLIPEPCAFNLATFLALMGYGARFLRLRF